MVLVNVRTSPGHTNVSVMTATEGTHSEDVTVSLLLVQLLFCLYYRVHTVWKVREKSIKIRVGQGKSGKARELFPIEPKGQGKSGKNFEHILRRVFISSVLPACCCRPTKSRSKSVNQCLFRVC